MLRGANKQEIFHDDEDCQRFMETLEEKFREFNDKENEDKCLELVNSQISRILGVAPNLIFRTK